MLTLSLAVPNVVPSGSTATTGWSAAQSLTTLSYMSGLSLQLGPDGAAGTGVQSGDAVSVYCSNLGSLGGGAAVTYADLLARSTLIATIGPVVPTTQTLNGGSNATPAPVVPSGEMLVQVPGPIAGFYLYAVRSAVAAGNSGANVALLITGRGASEF